MDRAIPRRAASATSLSKYHHELPDPTQSSIDFCNSFWGLNDSGVEVLFARMRGAARTMDEMRGFWRERAAIEEDYAKRLAKLAKLPLGRDEIGDLRLCMETLRVETDRQSASHLQFAQSMRRELEQTASEFILKQNNHKKTFQANIEKSYKAKQTQEKYVEKAREKYEGDCVYINSYTAQSTLLQGKELEKINLKLERAQQTVQANERDYQNFARALADTARRWEGEWKVYCDQCQDLEDERIEFIKDNVWAYANAVSTVCVADDESCEKIRVGLEQLDPDKDMENFVKEYGTGSMILEPTPFISYKANSPPRGPQTREANFLRSSVRSPLQRQMMQQQQPLPPPPSHEEEVSAGAAGIGAVGRESRASNKSAPAPSKPPAQSQSGIAMAIPTSVASSPPTRQMTSPPTQFRYDQQPPQRDGRDGGPHDPRAPTVLAIGGNTYPVDPQSDPQARSNASKNLGVVGSEQDRLAQALAELRRGGPSRNGGGSISRSNAPNRSSTSGPQGGSGAGPARRDTMQSQQSRGASPPSQPYGGNSPQPSRQYTAPHAMNLHDAASSVVGTHPVSRPTSPAANPHAAHMQPPPHSNVPLSELHQATFPGERRLSINRGTPGMGQPSNGSGQGRSPSPAREGFVGIGAQGRSPSPQPFHQPGSRSASPNPQHHYQQQQQQPQPQQQHPSMGYQPPGYGPGGSGVGPRATSPSNFGIALDASGRVAQDSMAEDFMRRGGGGAPGYTPQQPPPGQQPPYGQPPPQQQHPGYNPQQIYNPHASAAPPPQAQQPQYSGQPPYQNGYQQGPPPPGPSQPAGFPSTGSYPGYGGPPPPQQQQQQQQQPPQQQPPPQMQQPYNPTNGYANVPPQQQQRAPSPAAPPPAIAPPQAAPPQQQQQQQPPQQQQLQPQPQQQDRVPSPAGTGEEAGVLFYVKALYDYQASIPEEFDFQQGDIIAVTATPEDGWWSGMLLDDTRRQPGRTIFPSNFVCLF